MARASLWWVSAAICSTTDPLNIFGGWKRADAGTVLAFIAGSESLAPISPDRR